MSVRRINFPLILLAVLALLAGLWAGLLRMAWQLPLLQPTLPMSHGPLMVSGFLGTLIGLERAVGTDSAGRAALDLRRAAAHGPGRPSASGRRARPARPFADHCGQPRACGGYGRGSAHPCHLAWRRDVAWRAGLADGQRLLAVWPQYPAGCAVVGRLSGVDHRRRAAGAEPGAPIEPRSRWPRFCWPSHCWWPAW